MNGVDDCNVGTFGLQSGQNFFKLNFGQNLYLAMVEAQTSRAQGHLGTAFFACDIKRVHAFALQCIQGLQQQSGLADARIATDQNHAAFHHTAAQSAVELFDARGAAVDVGGFNVTQFGQL